MKKLRIALFPDTFLWLKRNKGIIYNSKNYKKFTFSRTDEIDTLCNTLTDLDRLYSVEISESLLNNKHVKQWVDRIIGIEAGCLIEENRKKSKLISYYPLLRVQEDINQIKWNHNKNVGGKIIENLHELIFYFNGSLHGSNRYFRQIYFPIRSDRVIDFMNVRMFVDQCINVRLNKLTFIGDISRYSGFEKLSKWVLTNDYPVHFVLLAEDIEENITQYELFHSDAISITIIINKLSTFSRHFKFYQNLPEKVTLSFPVITVSQFAAVLSFTEESGLKNYAITPLYTGMNRKFFEEYVYMTIDELNNTKLSKREVFANMTLNTYSFGKLHVMPEGKVYSNVNEAPLGSIGDPVYDMIYKEMTEGKSWFRVRDMKPCCDCVYQWLCPSPGNYELVIGKPDLCHL